MMKNWRQTGKKQPQNMDPVKNSESDLRYWPASVFISLFHFIWSTWLMPSGCWVYIRLLDVSSVWENSLQRWLWYCNNPCRSAVYEILWPAWLVPTTTTHSESRQSLFFPILMFTVYLCESSSPRLHGVHWVAAMWLLSYLFVLTSSWTFYPIKSKIPLSLDWLIRFPLKVFI